MASSAGSGVFYALWLPLIGLVVTGIGFGSKQRGMRGKVTVAALTCLLFASLIFQVACGGGSSTSGGGNPGTPRGAYTITVTGTYSTGSLVHTTPTTLTVQ